MNAAPDYQLFQYSLLHYQHSQALGEVLNVGVLVLFPTQSRVCFLYPERLTRLRNTYRNAPEKTLRAYFKGFVSRTRQLNQQPELFADFQRDPQGFIYREFLPADASALQFGPLKTSVLYTDNTDVICEQLHKQYLSFYEPVEERPRTDDQDLKINYRNRVKKLLQTVETRRPFSENYLIRTDDTPISSAPKDDSAGIYRFDFGWQNHALHLVKTVSFDVQKSKTIEEKAHANLGQFLVLDEYAQDKNIQFDLLVARPQDRALFSHYGYALNLLQRPKSVRLIEQEQLETYAHQTVDALAEVP